SSSVLWVELPTCLLAVGKRPAFSASTPASRRVRHPTLENGRPTGKYHRMMWRFAHFNLHPHAQGIQTSSRILLMLTKVTVRLIRASSVIAIRSVILASLGWMPDYIRHLSCRVRDEDSSSVGRSSTLLTRSTSLALQIS